MKTIAASEAKNRFGYLLDTSQRGPVEIQKKGRPVAVIMSLEAFEYFRTLEDKIWAMKAMEAEKEGFLSAKASKNLLDSLGNA